MRPNHTSDLGFHNQLLGLEDNNFFHTGSGGFGQHFSLINLVVKKTFAYLSFSFAYLKLLDDD